MRKMKKELKNRIEPYWKKAEKRSFEIALAVGLIAVITVGVQASGFTLDAGNTGSSSGAEGLVAEYRFDTGAGNTAYDTSGANNDGTINGATWTQGV
ncbi:MAG: hypothetical protein ABEJ03_03540, partial [Candidatus Nanohaloarchaea archaeon]